MNRRTLKFPILCLLLFCSANLTWAQHGAEELQKIVAFYRQPGRNISYRVHYTYFENQQSKPVDTMSIHLTQNGLDYHMKGLDFEWLKIGSELLWIDHSIEEMVLLNAKSALPATQEKIIGPEQVAQLVQEQGLRIQAFRMPKNQAGLRIVDPIDENFKLDLIYDPNSHCLLRLTLEQADMAEEGEASETFTKISAVYSQYQIQKGAFYKSLKQYVIRTKRGVIPSKTYSNYRVQTL